MDVHRIAQDVLYTHLGNLDYDEVREELRGYGEDPSDANVNVVVDYLNEHAGLY